MKHNSRGAKADNLKTLLGAGFNVPKFYTIEASEQEKLDNPKSVARLKQEFENWLAENDFASAAVRSSSTQEDSKAKSFAGQFTTILDVKDGDEFIRALRAVFNSKQSKAYSSAEGSVHIIVQGFIEPGVSGVIFSVNPANGYNELVINAASGRGTQVVEGGEADQYLVDRVDPTHIGHKGNSTALSPQQIKELARITFEIESVFGIPQDIEWAIQGERTYILQARPITHISYLRLWDSSNISESFPGIVLPLTFSIARRGYMLGYKGQAYSGGLSWYDIEAQHRTLDAMVGLFNGKMYYNLLNWYKFIALFPGSGSNQQFLDDQIDTQGKGIYQSPPNLSVMYKIRYFTKLIVRVIFFKSSLQRFYTKFKKFEGELARMPKSEDAQLLMLQYSHIEQVIIPQFARTLDNDFLVMTYHGLLKKLLSKWLSDKPFEKNSIIGSISGVMSAEQALSLHRLADSIKSDPKALTLLDIDDFENLDKHLEGTQLQIDIASYIEVFGHRFAQDQKIEVANPTLEPFGIYRVMKPYIMLDGSEVSKRIEKSKKQSLLAESNLMARLGPVQKIAYRWLLGRLKTHLRLREKNRLLRGKVYGYMRILFPQIGKSLASDGIISMPDDIHYLQIEEIYQILQGTVIVNDLKDRIEQRRTAYQAFAGIDMPDRFITTGLPVLEHIENVPKAKYDLTVRTSLPGLISSPGTVEGKVVVLREPVIPDEPYDILVASHTDPGWTPLIALAKGVIVEYGGMLSHAAIVTRELGIPSIIGVENVTSILKTGMRVRINTQTSCVEIIEL